MCERACFDQTDSRHGALHQTWTKHVNPPDFLGVGARQLLSIVVCWAIRVKDELYPTKSVRRGTRSRTGMTTRIFRCVL